MSDSRRRLPRTGGGMLRVVAKHVVLPELEEPERISQWLREIALTEGVEGWVAPSAGGIDFTGVE